MRKIIFGLAGIFAMLLIGCGGGDTVVDAVVDTPSEVEAGQEDNDGTKYDFPQLPADAND